jgi:hypothetical protein
MGQFGDLKTATSPCHQADSHQNASLANQDPQTTDPEAQYDLAFDDLAATIEVRPKTCC